MKVVTIGGGTGHFSILRALVLLKSHFETTGVPVEITALPVTTDNGGSSGILRLKYQVFAVGDISQTMIALHPFSDNVAPVFGHRFKVGPLGKHNARNMVVLSFLQEHGHNQSAMDEMAKVFSLYGRIAPITFTGAHLRALMHNGAVLRDEDAISKADLLSMDGIKRLYLTKKAEPNQAALDAIAEADMIVFCPGTLVCSSIAALLVEGIVPALQASRAAKVSVTNLMNRKGHEPEGWSVRDQVKSLETHLGEGFFKYVVCNTQPLSADQAARYEDEKVVVLPVTGMSSSGRTVIATPLLEDGVAEAVEGDAIGHLRSLVRHSPAKVASALAMVWGGYQSPVAGT